MKLTLCVPLIWMLFSSAEALQCVQDSFNLDPWPCDLDVQCLTAACQSSQVNKRDVNKIIRICAPSSLCNEGIQSFSMSFYKTRTTASLQCCSTDRCNNKDIPYLDEQKPNGLQCSTHDPWSQSDLEKQQCVGIEDRCIFVNMTHGAVTFPFSGCASANLCEGDTELKLKLLFTKYIHVEDFRFTAPKCCGSSLCSSAPSDKLSVISLLLGLVALSVH